MSELLGMPVGFWVSEAVVIPLILFRHQIIRAMGVIMMTVLLLWWLRKPDDEKGGTAG